MYAKVLIRNTYDAPAENSPLTNAREPQWKIIIALQRQSSQTEARNNRIRFARFNLTPGGRRCSSFSHRSTDGTRFWNRGIPRTVHTPQQWRIHGVAQGFSQKEVFFLRSF